jgi:hypothetical protein
VATHPATVCSTIRSWTGRDEQLCQSRAPRTPRGSDGNAGLGSRSGARTTTAVRWSVQSCGGAGFDEARLSRRRGTRRWSGRRSDSGR